MNYPGWEGGPAGLQPPGIMGPLKGGPPGGGGRGMCPMGGAPGGPIWPSGGLKGGPPGGAPKDPGPKWPPAGGPLGGPWCMPWKWDGGCPCGGGPGNAPPLKGGLWGCPRCGGPGLGRGGPGELQARGTSSDLAHASALVTISSALPMMTLTAMLLEGHQPHATAAQKLQAMWHWYALYNAPDKAGQHADVSIGSILMEQMSQAHQSK